MGWGVFTLACSKSLSKVVNCECVRVIQAPRGRAGMYLDAVLKSVMIFRVATGAMAEVVVPFGLLKAGFLSGCPVVLGVVVASEEGIYIDCQRSYGSTRV